MPLRHVALVVALLCPIATALVAPPIAWCERAETTLRPTAELVTIRAEDPHASLAFDLTLGERPTPRTDILFLFDVTGSMGDELDSAKESGSELMNHILKEVAGEAHFGVASFCDYPGTYEYPGYTGTYGAADDYPWRVNSAVSGDISHVQTAMDTLRAMNGEDGPENYSRALHECLADESVGWRDDAKRVVVLFGDAPPHDSDFGGENTGGDPGRDRIAQTPDDLDFQSVVQDLADSGVSVVTVDCGGGDNATAALRHISSTTRGSYTRLEDVTQLKSVVAEMLHNEATHIDRLEIRATGADSDWVSIDTPVINDTSAGATHSFNARIDPPDSAFDRDLLTSECTVHVIADGSEIATGELSIILKGPARPTNFLPSDDGYGFENEPSHGNWNAFVDYYGSDVVEASDGTAFWAARHLYDYWLNSDGSCYGMAMSAIAFQRSLISIPGATRDDLFDLDSPGIDDDGFFKREDSSRQLIDFQPRQADMRASLLFDHWRRQSPRDVRDAILRYLEVGEPVLVGVYDYSYETARGGGGGGAWDDLTGEITGHALVAYRFEITDDTTVVYVYDCNHPGDDGRMIIFDNDVNGWRYSMDEALDVNVWWSQSTSERHYVDALDRDKWEPMPDRKWNGVAGDSMIVVNPGNTALPLGVPAWNPARLPQNDWPTIDTTDIITFSGTGVTTPVAVDEEAPLLQIGPLAYDPETSATPAAQRVYVGHGTGKLGFALSSAIASEPAAVLFAQDSSVAIDEIHEGELDINLAPAGDAEVAGLSDAEFRYSVSRESTGSSRAIELSGLNSELNTTDILSPADDFSSLDLVNEGESDTYRIAVYGISAESATTYTRGAITIESGDRHTATVPDWDNMKESPPLLLIDSGNDGSIDETLTLFPRRELDGSIGGGLGDLWRALGVVAAFAALVGSFAVVRYRGPGLGQAGRSSPTSGWILTVSGEDHELLEGATSIGRSPQCGIVVGDALFSREHAIFAAGEGRLSIEDLGSTNGTTVNGHSVSSVELYSGDIIEIGNTVISVSRIDASSAT